MQCFTINSDYIKLYANSNIYNLTQVNEEWNANNS